MRRTIQFVLCVSFVFFAAGLYGQKAAKRARTSTFGGAKAALVQQTKSSSPNEIAFDIDLGMAHSRHLKPLSGLPQFSIVDWTGLSNAPLPTGATITTIAEEGLPEIPYLILTIAIPANAEGFEPFVTGEKITTLTNTSLPPRPYQVNDTTVELRYNAARYESLKTPKVHLSPSARFRSLRMIGLRIPLAEFDVKKGIVKARTKFRCGVRFTSSPVEGKAASHKPAPDKYLSGLYQSAVVNTQDIARYEVPLRRKIATQTPQGFDGERTFDTTLTGWIDRDAPYIKITATKTGLYRLTAQELSTSGIAASEWNANEVRLFNRGKEVPIWVETSGGKVAAIEFYGEKLPGLLNEYYNWSTDSNAYWLTNSLAYTGTPKRFSTRAIEATPSETIDDGISVLHHERDNFYFGGDNVTDESTTLHRTHWIYGERFVWRIIRGSYFDNGNLITFDVADTFVVAKLPADVAGKNARIRVFLKGISRDQDPTKDVVHKCELRLNGSKVSEVLFINFEDTLHAFDVPLNLIKEGANSFEVVFDVFVDGVIDQWYFDYYEVELPLGLTASQDTAIARGQWQFTAKGNADIANIRLTAGAEPGVYNLTDTVRLLSSSASGNVFTFRDSLGNENQQYVAATASSYLKPALISAWNLPGSIRWSDILDTTQGADYIVITHPEFIEASKTLAARRAAAGLRTKVVTTDEINNAFNYGSDEPLAIRNFLHYAFDFYSGTPPTFATLMGDATWDPKFNLNNSLEAPANRSSHRNFVHAFGVPSSDAIYTFFEGHEPIDSLNQDMIIARLPVESKEEAEHFLEKLAEYEARPPEEWNRHMLFTIGGTTPHENGNFWNYLTYFFYDNEWGGIRNSPLGINTSVVSRTDFSEGAGIDKTHVADLQREFREGRSIAYFFGHGATFITDVFFSDPGLYRNKGLYPVFITLSCRTGAYAEPNQITLNEAFLRQPDGGVIMAYGTTGFGEVYYDRRLTANIFNILRNDTVAVRQPASGPHFTNISSVFTLAKFVSSVIEGVGGTLSDSWYNSLLQYSVLGDAAMGFSLRPQPEFAIAANEVTLSDKRGEAKNVYAVTDSFITVTAKVHNFGRVAENEVHVSITNVQPKRTIVIVDTLARLDSMETITVTIPLDTFAVGTNQLRVMIDNHELYGETEERDNEVILTFQVSGFSATTFFPPEGAKNFCDAPSDDSVRFVLLLPSPSALSGTSTVEIEADTTSAFTSPISLGTFNANGTFFERSVLRSQLPAPSSGVIWWRSRLTIGGGEPTPWSFASANIASQGSPMFSYTTGDQLERTIISGLQRDADGALSIPQSDTIHWNVIVHGGQDTTVTGGNPISQILANGRSLATFYKDGIYVVPLTADNTSLADTLYEFLNPWPSEDPAIFLQLAKSFDSVIALIPEGRKVIVLTNNQPFLAHFTQNPTVTEALRTLGSLNGFDTLWFFEKYALIGTKGSAPGTAKEMIQAAGGAGMEMFDTMIVSGSTGTARTPFVFVANGYGKLTWNAGNLERDSSIVFRVLGEPSAGGVPVVVKSVLARGQTFADLSDIDARVFPRLAVEIRFSRPSDVLQSPRLYAVEYEYAPAPEFVIEENALTVDPAEVEEGMPTSSQYTVRNLLCIDGTNVPVSFVKSYQGADDTISHELITQFTGRTTVSFEDSISTLGNQGRVRLTAVVNPGGALNEQLLFNNASSAFFDVRRDSSRPQLDVLFDSIHIQNGDYVSSRVRIAMRLFDESPVRVKDSSSVVGVLRSFDGVMEPVTLDAKNPSADYNIRMNIPPSGSLQAELVVSSKIPLVPGRYGLTVFGFDGSGNPSDTLEFEFVVSGKDGIERVMNYPNPFTDITAFTFVLRSEMSANVNVYIYTTAGRRIRTLSLEAEKTRPGINSIEWDGRDESGSEVANGTYLYKVVLAGKNEDGSEVTDAVFEKAVRSR